MDVDGQPPRQPEEPEELPGQVLGEYLELLAAYVDERYTDAVVEESVCDSSFSSAKPNMARPAPTGLSSFCSGGGEFHSVRP